MIDFSENQLNTNERLSLVIEPVNKSASLVEFIQQRRDILEQKLLDKGAILFRGFNCESLENFDAIAQAYSPNRISYIYRSTPRSSLADRIYTTTEYPAKHSIPLHNENAYTKEWPLQLMFGCLIPALTEGATPLADMFKVTASIDPKIIEEFASKKVMYVRHYTEDADIPWQTVFQTEDQIEVSAFCEAKGIQYEWLDGGETLQTKQICQGVAQHPILGRSIFFNQAHLFHVSSHGDELANELIDVFGIDRLPRNAYFGDGSEIPQDMLVHIRHAFQKHSCRFGWESGDVLLIDNMQVSHGREPFTGERKVLAALFNPSSTT